MTTYIDKVALVWLQDGKVDYFNAIVNIPFINNDKGLNEAGTFKLLCPTCDGKIFQDYENYRRPTDD